jgi:selenide,water dikinase
VCFPEKGDLDILERILAGGLSKMIEAGCTIVGGHSIRDEETKFGYSITGVVHPQRVLANQGAKPGDKLLFTKAMGTGVISTAIKKGVAKPAWIDAAVKSMTTLNKTAAEVITGNNALLKTAITVGTDISVKTGSSVGTGAPPVHAEQSSAAPAAPHTPEARPWSIRALTDITGFGLIGHAREMALASDVSLVLHSSKIPLIDGAADCIRAGYIPAGLKANREFAECVVEYENGVADETKTILFDPQTAGGLLISVASEGAAALHKALNAAGVAAAEIGEVVARAKPLIRVIDSGH